MNAATAAYIAAHREQSAAEIAADLAADPRLASAVDTKALLAYAQHADLDVQLMLTAQHPACPAPLLVGIQRFERASAAGIPWNLDQADIAAKFRLWLAGMVQFHAAVPEAGFSQAQVDDLIAQFGGPMLEALSEAEVQAELDRLDTEDAAFALRQRCADAYNAVVALIEGAETLPTVLEVQVAFAEALEA